jgi:dUTP pyrophosphatase
MKVRFKKLSPEATTPTYSKPGDAGLDLTAISVDYQAEHLFTEYGTGIAVEIPEGYVGLLFSRSSVTKRSQMLKNAVGVIDSNYRGEIKLRFSSINVSPLYRDQYYNVGDRVGQLIIVPIPSIELEEILELSETNRGADGYGSTGN